MLDLGRGVLIGSYPGGAVIQRSTDGGTLWRTVRTLPKVALRWIGRDGGELVATGSSRRGAPLLLRSADAGEHWRVLRPRVPRRLWAWAARFAFSGRGGALATAPAATAFPDRRGRHPRYGVLRSGDHGRTWRAVRLPGGGRGTSATFTPGGRAAYATGATPACESAVSRSDDQGAHWRLLRSACGQRDRLLGVTFTDALHGLAVGGAYGARRARSFLLATADGGRTWRVRWRGKPIWPAQRLVFADRDHGWALSGGRDSVLGDHGGDGVALYTEDGGRHWRRSGRFGSQIAPMGLRAALLAEGDPGAVHLLRTADGGRRWTNLASLRQAGSVWRLTGTGSWLLAQGIGAGGLVFLSTDGGRRWRPSPLPAQLPTIDGGPLAVVPGLIVLHEDRACRLIVSRDGRTRQTVRGPTRGTVITNQVGQRVRVCSSDGVAFRDAHHGAVLVSGDGVRRLSTTSDGGRTWSRGASISDLPRPPTANRPTTSALFIGGHAVLSHDGGRSWTQVPVPAGVECDAGTVLREEIWLLCTQQAIFEPGPIATAGYRRPPMMLVFHSTDAATTWRAYLGPATPSRPDRLAAVAPGRAVGAPAGPEPEDTSLLSFERGGAIWRRTWPRFPIGPNTPAHPAVRETAAERGLRIFAQFCGEHPNAC